MAENASEPSTRSIHHPHSGNWYGTRGEEKLHFRFFYPDFQPKGLIFFIHGFGSSCNVYDKVEFFTDVMSRGYVVVCPDLLGHGHSDGLKYQILDYRHFVDDITYLLSVIVGDTTLEEENGCFKPSSEEKDTIASLPIFLAGESLGGLLAILAGLDIQNNLEGRFKRMGQSCGVLLFGPCLELALPPAPVLFVLNPIARMIPSVRIPQFLMTGIKDPKCIWTPEVLEKYPERTQARSYEFFTFGTYLQISACIENALSRNEEVKFPMLIFMDPDDEVVKFPSVERFVTDSSTPKALKKLLRMEGALHDIIANRTKTCIEELVNWCASQLDNISNSNGQ
eukprot:647_1